MLYCATDWTGMATADVPNALDRAQRPVAFPVPHRPGAAGRAQLPLPGAADGASAGLRREPGVPVRRQHRRSSTPARPSTTATAKAASTAAPCARCRSTYAIACSACPAWTTRSCCRARATTSPSKHLASSTRRSSTRATRPAQIGYSRAARHAYPDQSQRMFLLDLIQTLWDRSDPDGYASHMTHGCPTRRPPGAAAGRLRRPPGREHHRGDRGTHDRCASA